MERSNGLIPLSEQVKKRVSKQDKEQILLDGNFNKMVSTGSTLLDLAISSGRIRGGGLPGGILVEIFGPTGSGKTVLLCGIAASIQQEGGEALFCDSEARLDLQFAKLFGLKLEEKNYKRPSRVPDIFKAVRHWEPQGEAVHGIFADSLAALSTDMEMENEEGDKMGGRRAKEFSEQLRKTCRILKDKNYLMVCSNQIRDNIDAGPYGQKYISPGGKALEHYPSIRLRTYKPEKMVQKVTFRDKEIKEVVGVETQIEVFKSSIWKPYRAVPVTILFDYGIDNIRDSLQYIKNYSKFNVYTLGDETLDKSMVKSIKIIEEDHLETELREEVINLWEEKENLFKSDRKPKY